MIPATYSQDIGELERTLDSLNREFKVISMKVDSLEKEKQLLENQITKANLLIETLSAGLNPNLRIEATADIGAKVRAEPKSNSTILKDIPIGKKLIITNFFENNYLGAYYEGVNGYVSKNAIVMNPEVASLIRYHDTQKKKINTERLLEIEKSNPKLAKLIRRFGEENAYKILKNEFWIGMTQNMAIESLGKPNDINSSKGSWGTHEQWVYRNGLYLYFEDGILTSYQR